MLSPVSTAIQDLESLVRKAESTADSICHISVCQSKEQYCSLEALNNRLQEAAAKVAGRIERLEKGRAQQIREEGSKFLSQVETTRASIIENNQVKSIPSLRKSIALIFEGPKDSALDPGYTKSRKKQTRMRCEVLRGLNPDGVISWATGLPPHTWSPTCMQNHIFEYLVEEMEPDERQPWPSKIREILHVFKTEESFAQTQEYHDFLKDLDSQSRSEETSMRPRKRRRTEADIPEAEQSPPADGPDTGTIPAGRQIEYRYSEAPIDLIPLLGDTISDAVQSSQQWKWERDLGVASTTDCVNALAPRNLSQDISMTLLVGYGKGMQLIEKFQLVSR